MFEGFAGSWQGTNRLYLDGADGPMLGSTSRLTAAVVINGFLELRYDWVYEGVVKEGLLLAGHDATHGVATASWVDSFHQSKRVMFCQGVPLTNGVSVQGSYSAGEGPDWGWRIDLELAGGQLKLTMYNLSPEDGKAYLAVVAEYERV